MGAACAEKAARFSLEDTDQNFIEAFVEIRDAGLKLSNEDQNAFLNWQKSKKLPKNSEKEKKIRLEKINFYTAECAKIPLTICINSLKLTEIIQDFLPYCNKWLISDASIGASLSKAAFESSIFNIKINIPYIKDQNLLEEIDNFIHNKINYFNKTTEYIFIKCKNLLKP